MWFTTIVWPEHLIIFNQNYGPFDHTATYYIIFLKMETFGHLSTPSNIVYYNEKLDTPN